MIKDLFYLTWQLIKDLFEDHWLWLLSVIVVGLILSNFVL